MEQRSTDTIFSCLGAEKLWENGRNKYFKKNPIDLFSLFGCWANKMCLKQKR